MDYELLTETLALIGKRMIEVGAEINRAESSIVYMTKHFNAESCEVFALSNQITVSAKFEGKNYTVLKRVESVVVNFHRLDELNQLSRDVTSGKLNSVEEIRAVYDGFLKEPGYPLILTVLGSILCAAGFCVFFGGTWFDAISSAVLGLLIILSNKYIKPKINGFVHTVLISFIIGSIGIGFYRLVHPYVPYANLDKILIGTVMLMIPGMAITNGLRDIFYGDTISGFFRIMESIITAVCIAVGYGVAIFAFARGTTQNPTENVWYLNLISGTIGAMGYALIFHVRRKNTLIAAVGTILTVLLYTVVKDTTGWATFPVVFTAAIIASGVSEIMARIFKKPAIVYLTIAIMPLYPGGAIYYTLSYLVYGDQEMFLSNLVNTGWKILGIATGMVVSSVIFKYVFKLVYFIEDRTKRALNSKKSPVLVPNEVPSEEKTEKEDEKTA